MNSTSLLKGLAPIGDRIKHLFSTPTGEAIATAEGKEAALALMPGGEKAAQILDEIKAIVHLTKAFMAFASGNKDAAAREFTEAVKSGVVAAERGRMSELPLGQRLLEGTALEAGEHLLSGNNLNKVSDSVGKLAGFFGKHVSELPLGALGRTAGAELLR